MTVRGPVAGPGPRRLWKGLVLAVVAGAAALAALAVVSRGGGTDLAVLSRVEPSYLGLAGGLTLAAWWLRALRTQLLVRAVGLRVPVARMFAYYLSSVFVSHVTPTSTGGVPLFIYLLTREGLTAGQAAAVTIIDSGLVTLLLVVGWLVVVAWRGLGAGFGPAALWAAALGAVILVGVGMAWQLARPRDMAGLVLKLRRALARWRGAAGGGRLPRMLGRLARESLRFSRGLRFFLLSRPWALFATLLLTAAYWAAYLSIPWAVVWGLGARPGWTEMALRQLAFNLVQAFIPTPGGSGGAELMMAYLLRGMLPVSRLPVAVAAWRLFTFYASLLVGGLVLLRTLQSALGRRPRPSAAQAAAGPQPS